MKSFFTKFAMTLMAVTLVFSAPAWAQKSKLTPATRMIIADRDGNLSIESTNAFARGHQPSTMQTFSTNGKTGTEKFKDSSNNVAPMVAPFTRNGVKMVQCWIDLNDNNVSAIEALGVKVQAKFNGLVTADIPVNAIEKVAALGNVKKIAVANMMTQDTYYARKATNVDDVLDFTADAQAAGLIQAYDGTGVVIGIIDSGIQFDHQMFKDENGHTRIKKAIVFDTNTEQLVEYDTQSAIEALTYDTNSTYHGSHTSSIAGGSNFTVTGNYFDIENNTIVSNGTRTYGGMAPKADLVLCGLAGELTDANIASCIQKIGQYADQVGKPCVISISLGSQAGPHDGTGNLSQVFQDFVSSPGRVIVKAAGNDGDEQVYYHKSATKADPGMTLLNPTYLNEYTSGNYTLNNYFLYGQAITYARTPGVELAAKFYVINTTNNTIVWVSDEMTSDTQWSVNSNETDPDATYNAQLAQYFDAATDGGGYLCAFFDTDPYSGKAFIYTNIFYLMANDYTQSGNTVTGKYKIGLSCYPKNNGVTDDIDSWGMNYTYFDGGTATYSGTSYTFEAGNNKCSISDDGTCPYVIPIGSYTTSTSWVADANTSGRYYSVDGTVGDIASSSGFQEEGYGPLGTKLPFITAPGEMIIAAFNKGYVSENSPTSYLVKGYDANNPLGVASGTSMATPCAGGIVALWLQADPTLTFDQVKDLMQQTAITDSYVTGTNAKQFGNGKIDALAGIEELLPDGPRIGATPQVVTMNATVGGSVSQTVKVRGANLNASGNVNFTLSDANGVFSLDKAYIQRNTAQSANGGEFTITFTPTAEGTYTGTVTISYNGAEPVVVTINAEATDIVGTAEYAYLNIAKYKTIDKAGWRTALVNKLYEYKEYKSDKVAWLTLPVYGAVVGAKYSTTSSTFNSGNPQKWMATGVTASNQCGNTTWSATDVLLGSSTYFTSTTAMAVGTNSNSSRTDKTATFYVTNTTAVKLYCSQRSNSTTYYTSLKVYECTDNNGTLSASTTYTEQTRTTSGAGTLSITNLEASKIYKVEVSQARGYLYEIGFQTPLPSSEINATSQEFSGANKQLNFETIIGESQTKSFTVTGVDLEGDVTATLTDANGVFTLSTTTITKAQAEAQGGYTVDVTFNSATAGTFTGSITLSSQNAQDVTVNLNGVAHAPELIADPEELTFDTTPGTPVTGTFDVLGDYLKGDVTLTLNDANGVFSIAPATISKADAEEGATVTVTFSPTANGEYTGTVVLTSEGVEPVTVTLNGTAYPDGFPVTIGTYGVTTLYVDFPLIIPYDTYDPDILGVYYVKEISGGEAKFKRLENDIPANTAVVIQGNANTADIPAYIFPRNKGAVTPLPSENLLSGSLEQTTPAAVLEAADAPEGSIVMTLGRGNMGYIGFYKYSGSKLSPNKAFLIYTPAGSGVNSLSISGVEGEYLTGISEVGLTQEGAWYTVQGTRLNSKPRQSGIYIHNGKAVVVK